MFYAMILVWSSFHGGEKWNVACAKRALGGKGIVLTFYLGGIWSVVETMVTLEVVLGEYESLP